MKQIRSSGIKIEPEGVIFGRCQGVVMTNFLGICLPSQQTNSIIRYKN